MKRDDVIRMAREVGILETMGYGNPHMKAWQEDVVRELSHFAALVAAAEREACAKVCESEWSNVAERMYGTECAAAIRARGETK